ncbi:unnamed protein product [Cylindrotheca closterium]|uniref:Uncharacterized protein n=1 Tax=Cylindrotheca closterium TaxID=2856 RepID=A0AAD2FRT2_9STRA|nr:unnamed protein product [Cylindrotheca closterium]
MISSSFVAFVFFSLYLEHLIFGPNAFAFAFLTVGQRRFQQQSRSSSRCATKKEGYKFGDISRGLIGKFQKDVNSLTGKKKYELGDFTRWLDQKGRSEVGSWVQGFTDKPNYKVGDLSREVLRRLRSGEYSTEDIMLFLKIVAIVGANVQPVAAVLPMKVLVEMVEVSLAQDLSTKVVGILTNEVDSRMKEMVTGDKDYKLGDVTKKTLTGSKDYQLGDFTKGIVEQMASKDYEFGDITRKLLNRGNKEEVGASNTADQQQIEDTTNQIMEACDKRHFSSKQDDAAIKNIELEAWDQKLLNTIERKNRGNS